jgi:hypothetical protein
MILISHRGNINGKDLSNENNPIYLDQALEQGYDVECDIRVVENKLYLGHDFPQYKIDLSWLKDRKSKLWIHCKDLITFSYFKNTDYNYFFHQTDDVILTSKGYYWVFPGKQPVPESIAVMPEYNNEEISQCIGICSDKIKYYNK